ncbi:MAG TPA: CehA/McbA family metallohydrolase [Thermoplasmata archaeon]|nr:CehA/McbA family metallohydrolase [Thermoplasmata archaeon]
MSGIRLDLHVHSVASPDSRATIEEVADAAANAGLHGFALTDHNSIFGWQWISRIRERFPRLLVVPGVEVSTREGHLLVYGVSQLPPLRRPLEETVEWVERHGGVSVLAHPLRFAHGVGAALARRARVHAIESLNGHNSEVTNARAELIAAHRAIGTTGGSDAHDGLSVGRAFTEFPEEPGSVDEVLQSIRRSRIHGAGRSLAPGERFRLGLRTGLLRAARGFRPI